MPNMNETEAPVRKVLPIIYVLDTSGSMAGDRIAAVNEAMSETMEVLKDISASNADAEIKVGVLQFATGADWVTNGLVFMEDFFWNDIKAGGVTDFGSALNELHKKLSRSEFLISDTGFHLPVIIFMSDGMPTDDYEKALNNIKENNKWFRYATKIGIAVGDAADKAVLAKIAGNEEAVISVDDVETLKKLIKVVSASASKIGSQSRTSANADPAKDIVGDIKAKMVDDSDKVDFVDPKTNDGNNKDDDSDATVDVWDDDGWGDED